MKRIKETELTVDINKQSKKLFKNMAVIIGFFSIFIFSFMSSVIAMSPDVILPDCFQIKPIVKGIPILGSKIEIGFEVKAIFGKTEINDVVLGDANQKKLAYVDNKTIEKGKAFFILGAKALPDNKCTYNYSLSFKARLPEKELKKFIFGNYPKNMAEEYINSFPFGKPEHFRFSGKLYLDRFQSFFSDGASILKSTFKIGENYLFFKDFRISHDINSDIKKLKDLNRLMDLFEKNRDIKIDQPLNLKRDFFAYTLSLSSHLVQLEKFSEAIFKLESIKDLLPKDNIDNHLVLVETINNILVLKFNKAVSDPKNIEKEKSSIKEFINKYENLIKTCEKYSKGIIPDNFDKFKKIIPYLLHNLSLIRTTVNEKAKAVEGLTKALNLNKWMFETKKVLTSLEKGTFNFFSHSLNANQLDKADSNKELSLSPPDISGKGYGDKRGNMTSITKSSKWYLIPLFSLLILLFFLAIGKINKKF